MGSQTAQAQHKTQEQEKKKKIKKPTILCTSEGPKQDSPERPRAPCNPQSQTKGASASYSLQAPQEPQNRTELPQAPPAPPSEAAQEQRRELHRRRQPLPSGAERGRTAAEPCAGGGTMMAQRALPNPYADYDKSLATSYFDAAGRVSGARGRRPGRRLGLPEVGRCASARQGPLPPQP